MCKDKNADVKEDSQCYSCKDIIMNNECVNCEYVCINCANSDLCQRCVKEYEVNSCGCNFGYRLLNWSCLKAFFYVNLSMDEEGFDLVFTEDLLYDLTVYDIDLIKNNYSLNKILTKVSS